MLREEIIQGALIELGQVGPGEAVEGEDLDFADAKLRSLLTLLPLDGKLWSMRRTESLTGKAVSGTVTLAASYESGGDFYRIDASGHEIELPLYSPAAWQAIADKSLVADNPEGLFIDGDGVAFIYPIPTADVSINLYHTKKLPTPTVGADLNLSDEWCEGLKIGLADAMSHMYGLTKERRTELRYEWRKLKSKLLAHDQGALPNFLKVND